LATTSERGVKAPLLAAAGIALKLSMHQPSIWNHTNDYEVDIFFVLIVCRKT
jgi:hypothetical protein